MPAVYYGRGKIFSLPHYVILVILLVKLALGRLIEGIYLFIYLLEGTN